MKKNSNTEPSKKNIFGIIALLFSGIALGICIYNYTAIRSNRVACIETAKVLKSYKGIADLSKSFEEKNKLFKSRLDTLAQEFQNSLKEFEKKRSKLSLSEIQKEEQQLRKKQEEYESFDSGNQETLKNEEMKLIQKAVAEINDVVDRYAKNNGYSIVLGATPNSEVIYSSDYVNITEDIVKIVND